MPFRVLSFDLDDTIWPCLPTIIEAERALYRWLQINVPIIAAKHSIESLRQQRLDFIRDNPEIGHDLTRLRIESMRALSQMHDLDDRWVEDGFEVFHSARQKVTLFDDVAEVLDSLVSRFRLVALSNGNADIHRTGVSRWFSHCVSAEEVGAAKPDPAIFEALLSRTGCAAEEIIHIGDDPEHDIQGAYRSGITSIWVNRSGHRWPHDEYRADHEVADFYELMNVIDALSGADSQKGSSA